MGVATCSLPKEEMKAVGHKVQIMSPESVVALIDGYETIMRDSYSSCGAVYKISMTMDTLLPASSQRMHLVSALDVSVGRSLAPRRSLVFLLVTIEGAIAASNSETRTLSPRVWTCWTTVW